MAFLGFWRSASLRSAIFLLNSSAAQRCRRAKSLPVEPSFLEETGSARISGAFRFGLREHFLAFRMRGLFSPTFPSPTERADCWSLAGGTDEGERLAPGR
jgi:hypothetical protein